MMQWRKSSFSDGHNECIELAGLPDHGVAVRNSHDPGGPILTYTQAEFAAFIDGCKKCEFDDLVEER
jgi:hypothetical protein